MTRPAGPVDGLRAALILFAYFVAAGDFDRAEEHANNAFVIATRLTEEELADA
jgi:hypothetical protein